MPLGVALEVDGHWKGSDVAGSLLDENVEHGHRAAQAHGAQAKLVAQNLDLILQGRQPRIGVRRSQRPDQRLLGKKSRTFKVAPQTDTNHERGARARPAPLHRLHNEIDDPAQTLRGLEHGERALVLRTAAFGEAHEPDTIAGHKAHVQNGRRVVTGVGTAMGRFRHARSPQTTVSIRSAHTLVDSIRQGAAHDMHLLPHLGKDYCQSCVLAQRNPFRRSDSCILEQLLQDLATQLRLLTYERSLQRRSDIIAQLRARGPEQRLNRLSDLTHVQFSHGGSSVMIALSGAPGWVIKLILACSEVSARLAPIADKKASARNSGECAAVQEIHAVRVLSGIQPSGRLHIGNYFGALRQHLALQEANECLYFMASYHALTSLHNPDEMRQNTLDVALDYLTLGLDPSRTLLFRQQDVPEVTELTWIFSCVTPMGLLERAHSYKDKVARGLMPNVGLFSYPVLMAADILIYRSHLVPVGMDQKQHIEITRDIATKFNNQFGDIFPLPDGYILEETAVVPGVDGRKMSKSYGNEIEIFDEGASLKRRVMSIVTDSTPVEEPKDPETSTPFLLLKLVASPEETAYWAERYRAGGMGYGEVKKRLLELLDEFFGPLRERRRQLAKDTAYVEDVLRESGRKARLLAHETMELVREATGFPISYQPPL